MSSPTYTLTGHDAIRISARDGVSLHKHADPVEAAKRDISLDEAQEIAKGDASLIYATVQAVGWTHDVESPEGYQLDYFFAPSGKYLGPDEDGVEPTFRDAPDAE